MSETKFVRLNRTFIERGFIVGFDGLRGRTENDEPCWKIAVYTGQIYRGLKFQGGRMIQVDYMDEDEYEKDVEKLNSVIVRNNEIFKK